MAPTNVHLVAGVLALLSSVPYPGVKGGPKDALDNVKWLSYNFFTGVVDYLKGASSTKADAPNYLGAAIFVAYVAAALYFTFTICLRLTRISQKISDAQYPSKASFYSCLAFFSFTALAFNIFLFLVDSYMTWRNQGRSVLTVTTFTWTLLVRDVWQWAIESTIFFDFGRALCSSNGGYWWSAQALLTTMLSTFYMSATGEAYGVGNDFDFLLLSQILPISFAQNLFFVALLLRPISKEPPTTPRESRVLPEAAGWIMLVAYRVLIAYLPTTIGESSKFLAAIIATRVLLFLNYFVSFSSGAVVHEALGWAMLYRLPFIFVGAAWYTSLESLESMLASFTTNFAVNTLSIDHAVWLVSVVTFFAWDYVDRILTEWVAQRRQAKAAKAAKR